MAAVRVCVRAVVFGTVLSGMEVVDAVSQQPVDMHHRPLQPVTISDCGVLGAAGSPS